MVITAILYDQHSIPCELRYGESVGEILDDLLRDGRITEYEQTYIPEGKISYITFHSGSRTLATFTKPHISLAERLCYVYPC